MGGEEGGSDCVKVAVRCRPPSSKEIANNEGEIVEMVEAFVPEDFGKGQVVLNDPAGCEEPAKFAFDIVFGLAILQSQIYEAVGRPALLKTFEGYNGTIFAYGQTGSGKSFTMTGADGDLQGIIPRVNDELFRKIGEEQVGTRRFLVQCSYFEIYNEIIFDLLNPVSDRSKLGGGLQIKEHPVLGIYVKDLTEIVAEDANKLELMLTNGSKSRAVSSTMMNSTSSRSHSIFTIKVHQKDEEDTSRNVFAKLNLVDLAGSERQKGTGATGQTLKEGANINKSLSALGNVINALVECANGKKVFIPYRNSKLTRVLQESLGGNSLCTMLATLSPAACNYEETMSTLRYANRAKAIKVSATKNEEASQISRLKAEVEELKKKLENAGSGGGVSVGLSASEREAVKADFEKQLKDMEKMLNSGWNEKAKLSEAHERQMEKFAEERRLAAQALEEERARRLRLLREKNDLELSVRGLTDFVAHLPKVSNAPPVLTGDQPRAWLKINRSLKLLVDEVKDQCTLVSVFRHAFDEDLKLWGEGVETNDISIAATGLTRCMPKLEKFRKGGEKLAQLQVDALAAASELHESVSQALSDMDKQIHQVASEVESDPTNKAVEAKQAAFREVRHLLELIEAQVKEKTDEIEKKCDIEVGQTCEMVLQFSQSGLEENDEVVDAIKKDCTFLKALISDPTLAALPSSMPLKRLCEYTPQDVQNSPESTEALLGQLIRWEGLCGGKTKKSAQELLTRPPPKFLLDVAIAVKGATGFPANIETDWPDSRDEKLARFQSIADAVAKALKIEIDFEPTDVLKGKEVPKTLQLLQLLGVAAAKSQPTNGHSQENSRASGIARPRELSTLLEIMMKCIQGARQRAEAQRKAAEQTGSPGDDGEMSLEKKIASLQEELQEASRTRLEQENNVLDVERKLQETQNEMKQVTQGIELSQVNQHDSEEEELQRQLAELMNSTAKLGDEAHPVEVSDDDVIKMLQKQVEEIKGALSNDEGEVQELETKVQSLEKNVQSSVSQKNAAESALQRERQRKEMEEELMGQSPEEQKLILEAHQKKADMKIETIETQITSMQTEGAERKAAIATAEKERLEFANMAEEAQLQMQIVQEERDAMREAMEQLFNEKAAVDEELEDRQQAYNSLTERINALIDETCDLQDLLVSKEQGLRTNGHSMPGLVAA